MGRRPPEYCHPVGTIARRAARDRGQLIADQERLLEEHAAFTAEREAFLSQRNAAAEFASRTDGVAPGDEPTGEIGTAEFGDPESAAAGMQAFDSSDESPATDEEDVFARLRNLTLLKESTAEAEPPRPQEPPPREEPAVEPPRRTSRAEPAQAPADEEESIEAYMARLLNRMRGGVDEPAAPVASRPAPAPTAEVAALQPPATEEEPANVPTSDDAAPEEPLTMVPRGAAAPACDMAAMRALANLSVHSALTTHRKSHRRRKVLGKWFLAGMAAVLSGLLTFQVVEGDEVSWYATAIGWCLTAGCAAVAAMMSRQLLREGKTTPTKTGNDATKAG